MAIHDLFKVSSFVITLRDQKTIELMVQEVNLPSLTINPMEVSWQTMKDKRPGDSIDFANLTLTVLVDEDLKAYKEVYEYLVKAHKPVENEYDPRAPLFDSTLFLTTNKNNIQHRLQFTDCWITNVGDVTLNTTSSEDEVPTMTVEIVYNYFEFI